MNNQSREFSSWKGIPADLAEAWRKIYQNDQEGYTLSAPCPICSARTLRRYYQVGRPISLIIDQQHFVARGGCWEWCSTCKTYEHSSGLVPEWWSCDLVIDGSKLTAEPTGIEEAYKEQKLR